MKHIALTLTAFLAATAAFAQGTLNFANRVTGVLDAPVKDSAGVNLAGTGYWAQLLAAPQGGTPAPVGSPINFRTGAGAGYVVATSAVAVDGVAGGSPADVQLAAWDGVVGSTWAAASGAGLGGTGVSGTITVNLGGGGTPPAPAANLVGLAGFSLSPVIPEPSITALGLLGAGLLVIRRKK